MATELRAVAEPIRVAPPLRGGPVDPIRMETRRAELRALRADLVLADPIRAVPADPIRVVRRRAPATPAAAIRAAEEHRAVPADPIRVVPRVRRRAAAIRAAPDPILARRPADIRAAAELRGVDLRAVQLAVRVRRRAGRAITTRAFNRATPRTTPKSPCLA